MTTPAPRSLLSVAEALGRVLDGAKALGVEAVGLSDALGRTLAEPIAAKRTQPPFRSSAMDGYAVRADDARAGAALRVVGEAAAGHIYPHPVAPGEAVRIFTGGAVPEGADAVLIQENAERSENWVRVLAPVEIGQNIRGPGIDFEAGDVLLEAGAVLTPRGLGLAGATGHTRISVARRPRVGILATGDELVPPGAEPGPGQITASNSVALAALVEAAGGAAMDLGIAPDRFATIQAAVARAQAAEVDILVTTGGASVGEHDLVQQALRNEGMDLDFWRIAMRPGRPMMFGRLGAIRMLGLPGNPVSAHVCAVLFLVPLVRALLGRSDRVHRTEAATLGTSLKANDWREDYIRARLTPGEHGSLVATPFGRQDSSLMRLLADADCLIVRPAEEPAKSEGELCRIIRFGERM